MSCAGWATIEIAKLCGTFHSLSAWCFRNLARAWRKGGEDWVESLRGRLIAADHHAIAALQTPNPATRSRIQIMDSARLKHLAPTHVIFVKRIAAINDR